MTTQRRTAARVVLAAFVFALSLTVVVAQPDTAEALAPAPVAVVIGEELAGAAAPEAVACMATLVCAVPAALVLAGAAAYMTKDTWLPVVSGLLGKGQGDTDVGACTSSVVASISSQS